MTIQVTENLKVEDVMEFQGGKQLGSVFILRPNGPGREAWFHHCKVLKTKGETWREALDRTEYETTA